MKRIAMLLLLFSVMISGCAVTTPKKDYAKFNAANPRSILIVPVTNQSAEVTAPDYFLSTVSIPLAERGYYVFPVNLVKRILEDEGLSDSGLVHSAPAEKVCGLFGADSVLYVDIKEWSAKYMLLATTVTVQLAYKIKDCKTNDTLWEHEQTMNYTPQSSSSGHPVANLVVMAITAAVAKAAPNYVPLARQANSLAFYPHNTGIPLGPYARSTTN